MNAPARFPRTLIPGALAGLCLAGCASLPKPPSAHECEAICRRAEVLFQEAVIFKPSEPASGENLTAKLAPLFICELTSTNAAEARHANPWEVSFFESEVMVSGKAHRQVSFVWKRPGPKRQGVRITLNLAGLPAVWEVLDGGARARVVFVSQNLEAGAMREFGPPLPGRRFAVERAVGETPDVVVARVNDDAPVAMGPIVHLDAHGKITTVNCRCMTTQARQLVRTANYVLKPLPAKAGAPLESRGLGQSLEQALRLPASF